MNFPRAKDDVGLTFDPMFLAAVIKEFKNGGKVLPDDLKNLDAVLLAIEKYEAFGKWAARNKRPEPPQGWPDEPAAVRNVERLEAEVDALREENERLSDLDTCCAFNCKHEGNHPSCEVHKKIFELDKKIEKAVHILKFKKANTPMNAIAEALIILMTKSD